jgi:hypothetical protein
LYVRPEVYDKLKKDAMTTTTTAATYTGDNQRKEKGRVRKIEVLVSE